MYSISGQGGRISYGVKNFICDVEEDILRLPKDCETGSTAFVIETSKQYMLNNKKEWKQCYYNEGYIPGGDIIYDGGTVEKNNISVQDVIYDGGMI